MQLAISTAESAQNSLVYGKANSIVAKPPTAPQPFYTVRFNRDPILRVAAPNEEDLWCGYGSGASKAASSIEITCIKRYLYFSSV